MIIIPSQKSNIGKMQESAEKDSMQYFTIKSATRC